MFNYLFYRLYLVNAYRVFPEIEEVADKYRTFLLVGLMCEFLEFLVAACSGSQLQQAYSIRVPCVLFSVFPVREHTYVFKD